MTGRVVVVGSINVDLVVTSDRLPLPGETVLGGRFAQHPGGKGANQAVAAARVGAEVSMIGAVGTDAHGDSALAALTSEGIDVSRIRRVTQPTGVALIAVGRRGENQIVLAPGANDELTAADISFGELGDEGVLLTDHEIPAAVTLAALRAARAAGWTPILDPAPARALSADVLQLGPILTPNEHELLVAIGDDNPQAAAASLAERNRGPLIVTQGPAGALLVDGDRSQRFPGFAAGMVVDTTGAGDAFTGVLAAWLAEGKPLDAAIHAANAAGALAVTAAGARGGMPHREALLEMIGPP
ncbi:MAG: ribokinase [Chloroflexota bacterium]|nr:ribokinase [Chloroflexota bacterium]